MHILMISKDGDGLGLAAKWNEVDGVEVTVALPGKKFAKCGEGLVHRVPEWRPEFSKADLILADMVGVRGSQELFRSRNKPNLGFNLQAAKLELDRAFQMEIFNQHGISTPPYMQFSSPQEALIYRDNIPAVVKPSGNKDTGKTMVVRSPREYLWALNLMDPDQELIIQEFIEGIEVSTEGWFTGQEFVPHLWTHTFEEKRLMHGDIGPNTGCMGNLVMLADPDSQLCRNVEKLRDWLRLQSYRGPVDLNTIVSSEGIFALEATMRFGYDAMEAQCSMMRAEGQLSMLGDLARGLEPSAEFQRAYGTAVRLARPPYPFDEADPSEAGLPIEYSPSDDIYWTDTYQEDDNMLWSASDGVICKVVGVADSMERSWQMAYQAVDRVRFNGKMYREDIGDRVPSAIDRLTSIGVL